MRKRAWLTTLALCGLVAADDPLIAKVDCEAPAQAAAVIRQAPILLVGEIHGMTEGPALIGELVCEALRQGYAVTVGLELPRTLQESIDAYLESDGSRQAKGALLAEGFWQRDYQDGRTSVAVMDLIGTLRAFRSDGQEVRIVAFDVARRVSDRDREMASALGRAATERRDDRLIVLTGNLHARLARGRAPGGAEPMGFHLGMLVPGREVLSLNLTHSGGSAWICTGGSAADCGPRQLGGAEAPPGLEIFTDARQENYSGRWHLGPITASRPAKEQTR